ARAFTRIERELVGRGIAAGDGPYVRLPEFTVQLTLADQQRAAELTRVLVEAGASPPGRSELASRFGVSDELIDVLVDSGTLVPVAPDLVYARQPYEAIVNRIVALIQESGPLTVAQVRDAFGTSRKFAL